MTAVLFAFLWLAGGTAALCLLLAAAVYVPFLWFWLSSVTKDLRVFAACLLRGRRRLTRRRLGRGERQARRVFGVPANHPERITGSDKAGQRGHFPLWAAELAEDGIDAGQIISDYRRGG